MGSIPGADGGFSVPCFGDCVLGLFWRVRRRFFFFLIFSFWFRVLDSADWGGGLLGRIRMKWWRVGHVCLEKLKVV